MGWTDWLFKTALGKVVDVVLVAIGGTALTFLRKRASAWFVPALWGLVGCALVAICLGAIAAYRAFSCPRITPENAETQVRRWLDDFGLSVKKLSKDQAPGLRFALEVRLDSGIPVVVACPADPARQLVFQATVQISPAHRTLLQGLTKAQTAQLLADLRIEMARARASCMLNLPEKMVVNRGIAITGALTEDAFMERLSALEADAILARDTFVVTLGRLSQGKAWSVSAQ